MLEELRDNLVELSKVLTYGRIDNCYLVDGVKLATDDIHSRDALEVDFINQTLIIPSTSFLAPDTIVKFTELEARMIENIVDDDDYERIATKARVSLDKIMEIVHTDDFQQYIKENPCDYVRFGN